MAQNMPTRQIYLDAQFSEIIKEKAGSTLNYSYSTQTIDGMEFIINIHLINDVFIIINTNLGENPRHKMFPKGVAVEYSGIKLFPSFRTDTPLKSLRLSGHEFEFNILQMCIYILRTLDALCSKMLFYLWYFFSTYDYWQ